MVKLSEWDSKCIPAAVSALTLPAATHHSSKGSKRKQQSHSDMASLVESLRVQQTCFTVALLKAALFLFLLSFLFFSGGWSGRWVLICFQCICGTAPGAVMSFPLTNRQCLPCRKQAGWMQRVGSRPMKVQRERGPVEQVCNLCVIWHCTSTPILCSRRWAGLRMRKKWHYM